MQQHTFLVDDAGFIVSAELVLVATIVVIGMIVGLSEVQHSVVQELNDVGEAFGKLNQSYLFTGFGARKFRRFGRWKSFTVGSFFFDSADDCDCNDCAIACAGVSSEGWKFGGTNAYYGGVSSYRPSSSACAAVCAPTCAPACGTTCSP